MFTGIVQQIGVVRRIERGASGAVLHVGCRFASLVLGESIATQGVCLTVTRDLGDGFLADASAETLATTKLGALRPGSRVHLERALSAADRLGGHLVSGHVDGVGHVVERSAVGDAAKVVFEVPPRLAPFLAPKGSITIDGVSLTVNGASGDRFDVMLVPFTRSETLFDELAPGDAVNLEVDVLAKYVARLLGRPGVDGLDPGSGGGGVTLDLLRRHGYI
ncbi:MAG: riboflavin synthase [Polyangiales bacterium]